MSWELDLLHCCWSAKNVTRMRPISTRANMISAPPKGTPSFEARSRMYVGVVIRKRRTLWAREMKVTLKRKNATAGTFARMISLLER